MNPRNLPMDKISGMYIDIYTTNKSFLTMSRYLKKHNVKNNKFMLGLYNPELSGVDPFSETLTSRQKALIFEESTRNKWYFIREVSRIPVDGAIDGIRYELNIGNLGLTYVRSKNINQLVILPRQVGKTIGYIMDDVWSLNLVASNANVIYLNKEFKDSKKNLKQFKDIRYILPGWFKSLIQNKKDIDNEEKKIVSNRNNTLEAKSSAMNPSSADKLGRGLSTSSIVFDEFAFLKYNQIIYEACLPAWKQAASEAKKNGVPYGITIVTTPNNLDVPEGEYCYRIRENAARFILECFDMTDDELQEYLKSSSTNDFMLVEFSYKEIGKTEEWFNQSLREFQGNLAKLKREVLLEWPRSRERTVFSEAALDKLHHFVVQEPKSKIFVNKQYVINFYEDFDISMNYILSCDVAGGLSQDNSVISIIHPGDFRVVGDFKNKKIDTDDFKKLIYSLMTFYFPQSLLVVERNSYGLNILDSLMKDPIIEPRMYRELRTKKGEKSLTNGLIRHSSNRNYQYGVNTTSKSRALMYDLLMNIVEEEPEKIQSPHLFADIAALERTKTGRLEAGVGAHDDNLMSYLIFRYAVFYGNCFRDRFGISPVPTSSNVRTGDSDSNIIRKLERSVMAATDSNDNMSTLRESELYRNLREQQINMGMDIDENTRKTADSIRKIIDLNSY